MVKEPVPQYVVNKDGERTAVILDIEAFEEMLEIIDDYYCTKAYDESKPKVDAEIKRGDYSTLDEFLE